MASALLYKGTCMNGQRYRNQCEQDSLHVEFELNPACLHEYNARNGLELLPILVGLHLI